MALHDITACAVLAASGLLTAGVNPAGAAPRTAAAPAIEIRGPVLPNLVYAGEPFNVFLRLVNHDDHAWSLTATAESSGQRVARNTSLPPGDGAGIVLPLKAPMAGSQTPSELRVMDASATDGLIWKELFVLRGIHSDLTDLRVGDDGSLVDRSGVRTVLVNSLEDETRYRRWAPVKWAIRQWRFRGAPRGVWAPVGLMGDPAIGKATAVKTGAASHRNGIVGSKTTRIPYDGNPLQAAIDVAVRIPRDGRFVLCILWGYDEAIAHLPVQEFARALDAAIDRVRTHNPDVLVCLATPPPVPGEEGFAAAYTTAIRKLAGEHHARLIDLYAKALAEKDWHSLYAVDGDPTVLGFYPSPEGCAHLSTWIGEGLP